MGKIGLSGQGMRRTIGRRLGLARGQSDQRRDRDQRHGRGPPQPPEEDFRTGDRRP